MHECPRCGFIQPKDRYCANCGLDIDHYKPAPRPLLKRIAENTMFQVLFVVVLVGSLGTWIYFSQRRTIQDKLNSTLQMSSPNTASSPDLDEPSTPPAESTRSTETSAPPPAPAAPTTMTPTPAPKAPAVEELNIQFVELSRLYLSQLAQEHQVVDETAATRSIVMAAQPNIAVWRDRDPQFQTLPGSDTHSVRAGRPIHLDFTQMAGGPNDIVGMNLEIVPSNITDQTIDLAINGMVTLRTLDGSISSYGFEGRYTLPNTSTLLVSGAVPHQSVRPEDQEIFASTPLVILGSPEFMNNTSELVLVIQPK